MDFIKISEDEAKRSNWTYFIQGQTEEERWLGGNEVRCRSYLFSKQHKTVVKAKIEAGAFHGRTTAASDYYYLVLLGRGTFFFYEKNGKPRACAVEAGDCLLIPAGTDYDYQAQHQNLEVALFMNNLWNE